MKRKTSIKNFNLNCWISAVVKKELRKLSSIQPLVALLGPEGKLMVKEKKFTFPKGTKMSFNACLPAA